MESTVGRLLVEKREKVVESACACACTAAQSPQRVPGFVFSTSASELTPRSCLLRRPSCTEPPISLFENSAANPCKRNGTTSPPAKRSYTEFKNSISPRCRVARRPLYSYQRYHSPKTRFEHRTQLIILRRVRRRCSPCLSSTTMGGPFHGKTRQ